MTTDPNTSPTYAVSQPADVATQAPPIASGYPIPAGVTRPADHQQAEPGRAELAGQLVDVHFEGLVYRVEVDTLNDLDILERVEDGNFATVLREVLGDEQWNAYKDSKRATPGGRATATGFDLFINAIFDAVKAGKS